MRRAWGSIGVSVTAELFRAVVRVLTGSALLIPSEGLSQRFFWAARAMGPPDPAYSPYDELPRVGDTLIFGDHVRLVWQVQGRSVWVEPPPDCALLTKLVRLTRALPAPAPAASE